MAALRTALFSIGVVALSWFLAKFGSTYQTLALVGIFSAGVLLLIEAAILHRKIRHGHRERERLRQEGSKSFEVEHWLTDTRPREDWFWRVGTSLLLVSFGFISLLCYSCSRQADHSQITLRFHGEIEKAIIDHSVTPPTPPSAGPVTINSTLKLDPKLEDALQEYLRKPPASNGGMPWNILIAIMLAAAVAALVWWAISHKPDATPLTS